jgi:hypothetical protein
MSNKDHSEKTPDGTEDACDDMATNDGDQMQVSIKEWQTAPSTSCGEKCEMCVFRFITWIPVIITFILWITLCFFYCFVSQLEIVPKLTFIICSVTCIPT